MLQFQNPAHEVDSEPSDEEILSSSEEGSLGGEKIVITELKKKEGVKPQKTSSKKEEFAKNSSEKDHETEQQKNGETLPVNGVNASGEPTTKWRWNFSSLSLNPFAASMVVGSQGSGKGAPKEGELEEQGVSETSEEQGETKEPKCENAAEVEDKTETLPEEDAAAESDKLLLESTESVLSGEEEKSTKMKLVDVRTMGEEATQFSIADILSQAKKTILATKVKGSTEEDVVQKIQNGKDPVSSSSQDAVSTPALSSSPTLLKTTISSPGDPVRPRKDSGAASSSNRETPVLTSPDFLDTQGKALDCQQSPGTSVVPATFSADLGASQSPGLEKVVYQIGGPRGVNFADVFHAVQKAKQEQEQKAQEELKEKERNSLNCYCV